MTEISEKKSFLVTIGAVSLYCEKMTMTSETVVSLNPTINGTPIVTNKCRKMTKLSFTGRVYMKENSMFYAGVASNLNGCEDLEIIYKNLRFTDCIVTGFTAVDGGEDYIELTVNASTTVPAYIVNEVT